MTYFCEQCIDVILDQIAMIDLSEKSTVEYFKQTTLEILNSTTRSHRSDLEQRLTGEPCELNRSETDINNEYEPRIRLLTTIIELCDKELQHND